MRSTETNIIKDFLRVLTESDTFEIRKITDSNDLKSEGFIFISGSMTVQVKKIYNSYIEESLSILQGIDIIDIQELCLQNDYNYGILVSEIFTILKQKYIDNETEKLRSIIENV